MPSKYPSFKQPTVFLAFGSKSDRLAFIINLFLVVVELAAFCFVLLFAYHMVGKPDFKKATVILAVFDEPYSQTEAVSVPKSIHMMHLLEDANANSVSILAAISGGGDCTTGTDLSTEPPVLKYESNIVASDVWAAMCTVNNTKCARSGINFTTAAGEVAYTDADVLKKLLVGECFDSENEDLTVALGLGQIIAAHPAIKQNPDIIFTTAKSSETPNSVRKMVEDGDADAALIIPKNLSANFITALSAANPDSLSPSEIIVSSGASYALARQLKSLISGAYALASQTAVGLSLKSRGNDAKSIASALSDGTSANLISAAIKTGSIGSHISAKLNLSNPLNIPVPAQVSSPIISDVHPALVYGEFLFAYIPFVAASVSFVIMAIWFFPLWRTQPNGKVVMGPLISAFGKILMYVCVAGFISLAAVIILVAKGTTHWPIGGTFIENGHFWWALLSFFVGCLAIAGLNALIYGLFGSIGSFINGIITFYMITSSDTMMPLHVLPNIVRTIAEHTPMYHAVSVARWAVWNAPGELEMKVHWLYLIGYICGGLILGLILQGLRFGRKISSMLLPRFFGVQSVAQAI